jgi:hypothetical protein
MSDARYYLVGENDVWMVQFGDCERGDRASHNDAVAFAIAAAQELGMQGESAMCARSMITAASDTNGPMIGIIV